MRKLLALSFIVLVTAGAVQAQGHDPYYTNSQGDAVHRPMHSRHVPRGATARCRDRSYSFSENHRGTCSHHGGVAEWLN
jgi:hypothetical protein